MASDAPLLTDRFLDAVSLAEEVHGRQRRTGTEVPYMAHLLVVTGLVIEDGGDEDEAVAAMLHDSVEEGGGPQMLDRIKRQFGPRVAAVVEACSDTVEENEDETWIERKRRYLEHLPEIKDDAALRVSLADKVQNVRSLVREYREASDAVWERSSEKSPDEQLWYYHRLLDFFRSGRPGPLTEDLARAVEELDTLVVSHPA
jgi:(p)ppGpp synthase/HD superfamily hydrolase